MKIEVLGEYKHEMIGTGVGLILGLMVPSVVEFFLNSRDISGDNMLRLLQMGVRNPWVRAATTLAGGFMGLMVANGIGLMREHNEGERVVLPIGERGSVRVAVALTAGVLAAGVGVGALAEPAVNTGGQLISKIGEVAISSPAISPVGRFY